MSSRNRFQEELKADRIPRGKTREWAKTKSHSLIYEHWNHCSLSPVSLENSCQCVSDQFHFSRIATASPHKTPNEFCSIIVLFCRFVESAWQGKVNHRRRISLLNSRKLTSDSIGNIALLEISSEFFLFRLLGTIGRCHRSFVAQTRNNTCRKEAILSFRLTSIEWDCCLATASTRYTRPDQHSYALRFFICIDFKEEWLAFGDSRVLRAEESNLRPSFMIDSNESIPEITRMSQSWISSFEHLSLLPWDNYFECFLWDKTTIRHEQTFIWF